MSDLDLPSTPPAPLGISPPSPPHPSFLSLSSLSSPSSAPRAKRAHQAAEESESDGTTSEPPSLRRKVDQVPESYRVDDCFLIIMNKKLAHSSSQDDLGQAVKAYRKDAEAEWVSPRIPKLKLDHYDFELVRGGFGILCTLNEAGMIDGRKRETERVEREVESGKQVMEATALLVLSENRAREAMEAMSKELEDARSDVAARDALLGIFEGELISRKTYEWCTRTVQMFCEALMAAEKKLKPKNLQPWMNAPVTAYQIRTPVGGAPFIASKVVGNDTIKAEGVPIGTVDLLTDKAEWLVNFDAGLTIVEQEKPVLVKAAQLAVLVVKRYGEDRHTSAHANFDQHFVENESLHRHFPSPYQLSAEEQTLHTQLMKTMKINRNPMLKKNKQEFALDS
ncbi:hypothetical protein RQP46_007239 [Phenoliferia psychrophenolica]